MKETITKISIFDFDGTLINTATPDTGKDTWKDKTGQDWPYIGWWSKKESLDSNVFDNNPISSVIDAYKVESNNPNTLLVMMTGRISKLSNEVESILLSNGLKFDE
jgi:FMN phosphatase YigB (HAD superfamily)